MTSGKTEDKTVFVKSATQGQRFKEFVTNVIKEQSTKIQNLFQQIQSNAQTVLKKIDGMKKSKGRALDRKDGFQIEAPELIKKKSLSLKSIPKTIQQEGRNFASTYPAMMMPSGHGLSAHGSNNYGGGHYGGHVSSGHGSSTYHHHSIGFDPINIVVSVSLLSFLLQAIQGLLARAKIATPVIEARSMDQVPVWLKWISDELFEELPSPDQKYSKKKKLQKKFLNYKS